MIDLPVETILEELHIVLEKNTCAALQAPPGAGKTTRVPLAMMERSWLGGRKILSANLEPERRVLTLSHGFHIEKRYSFSKGGNVWLTFLIKPASRVWN